MKAVIRTLEHYVKNIKVASDEEAKEILASFFVRSLIDDKFRNKIIDEIERKDKIYEN
jgi:hypothetical protein